MSAPSSARLRAWAPHLAVGLWLVFLGAAVWWHAARSGQAPMWDPYSYLAKAKNFWDCVGRGAWCNPFDLEPTVRPPGTILLSYPFGFSPSFAGFHFRSVFLPVLCAALAPYLALGVSRAFAWGWGTCATVLLFTSLPMFYHFEWTPEAGGTGGWGMVDGFISGIAALAAALLLRSLGTASLARLAAGAALGAFTLFIKPAGAMVMVLLAATWAFLAGISWLSRSANGSRRDFVLRYALPGGILMFCVFAASALVSRFSGYLSPVNFSYARKALAFERTLPGTPLAVVLGSLHMSVGVFLPLWAAAVALLSLAPRGAVASDDDGGIRPGHLVICALAVLVAGAWYWIVVQVLASQVRYFWPFVWLACVCLVPAAWRVWRDAGRAVRGTLAALCALPAASLAVLLPLREPPARWERIAGVHLDVGTSREAEEAARDFLPRLLETPGTKRIYSFASDLPCGVFEHVIRHELIVRGRTDVLSIQHAYDWVRGFVVRTDDIVSADYLLFVPPEARPPRGRGGSDSSWTGSFGEDNEAFIQWVAGLGGNEGVTAVIDNSTLRLLRIVNRGAFDRSLTHFVGSRRWSPQFEAENPRRWWSAEEVAALPGTTGVSSVRFGKRYLVHAVALARSAENLTIDLWWQPIRPDPRSKERSWFFHLLGPDGKMIGEAYLPLRVSPPPDRGRPVRLGRALIVLDKALPAAGIGFGLYSPESGVLLQADGGTRDWNGRRVLVPLTSSSAAAGAVATSPER